MTRSWPQEHPDFFVEWQISDQPGTFIDLAADPPETEIRLAEQAEVRATTGG